MSLDYAILGFLNYMPQSGYDLKKVFDSSVQHFWPADQSQIYRTLSRLTVQGYVEHEKIKQEEKPDRKVYHTTEAGRIALLEWLSAPAPLNASRNAALIQVFFLGRLPDEAALAKFEDYANMLRGVLAVYDQLPERLDMHAREIGTPREKYFWFLTLDLGIRSVRANLEWTENIIDQIKKGQVPKE